MAELSAIVTDDEDDYLYSSFTAQSRQNAAASCLQQQWNYNRFRKNVLKLKKALVLIQAHARRKYLWGVNDESSKTVLNVFELRKVLASMRHALSIVRYVQFLVDNSELLEIVYNCKEE